jgi:hypothetical protein
MTAAPELPPQTANADCAAACSLDAPFVDCASWTTVGDVKTVTAGTVFVKIDKAQNATHISTKSDALPTKYSQLRVNSAGTRVETVRMRDGFMSEAREYVL